MPLPFISIDNFRVFKEKTEFEFAPITILTGTNSSGKSSLVDALRILQNYTEEIPNPDSKKFWDRIINFKEDYLHSRIPGFRDLINYNGGESIRFKFKCKFIGMSEDVTVSFEFNDKDGVNGILKSLKYTNEGGADFFSMEIKQDNITHIKIDFGFLYKKFEKEIEKEIKFYDLNLHINNDNFFEFRTFFYTKYINELIEAKLGIENKEKSKVFIKLIQYDEDLNVLYNKRDKLLEEYYEDDENGNPSWYNSLQAENRALRDELTEFCNNYHINLKEINYFRNKIGSNYKPNLLNSFLNIFKDKTQKEEELEIFEAIKKDFENGEPLYDLKKYYEEIGKPMEIETVEHQKDKLRLKDILKGKFNIDVHTIESSTSDSEWFNIMDNAIELILTQPIDVMSYGYDYSILINSEHGQQEYSLLDIIDFLHKYFEIVTENSSPNDTISNLGHLFYDKFIYENICNSLTTLKEKLGFNFIPSIRNSPERFYLKKKEGYFENILSEFKEKIAIIDGKIANVAVAKFLNSNLKRFNIGREILIERHADLAVYSIYILKQDNKINLMDLGHGISQVMPIMLKIALIASEGKTKSIIIEEPETNLHPALQSKLADMFMEANKLFDIQFIIETHSEYLIRKLQYLTMKAEIKPSDTQIYYFYHPDEIPEGEPQVKKINIYERGVLSDEFGTGFFDEADKIAMSIWSMNQSQKN